MEGLLTGTPGKRTSASRLGSAPLAPDGGVDRGGFSAQGASLKPYNKLGKKEAPKAPQGLLKLSPYCSSSTQYYPPTYQAGKVGIHTASPENEPGFQVSCCVFPGQELSFSAHVPCRDRRSQLRLGSRSPNYKRTTPSHNQRKIETAARHPKDCNGDCGTLASCQSCVALPWIDPSPWVECPQPRHKLGRSAGERGRDAWIWVHSVQIAQVATTHARNGTSIPRMQANGDIIYSYWDKYMLYLVANAPVSTGLLCTVLCPLQAVRQARIDATFSASPDAAACPKGI